MMTRKAHALGMSNTIYRNASGLPNDEQVTTARDLTILARSLEERFPRYFKYFSTHEFDYAGEAIGNHNHLLGRVDGVDGIKTGYTRASGFNLLTSVHRDGRSLIAVVMGGRTAGARDRIMEEPHRRPYRARPRPSAPRPMIADASDAEEPAPRAANQAPPARPRPAAVAASVPARLPAAAPAPQLWRKATTRRRTRRRRFTSRPSTRPPSLAPPNRARAPACAVEQRAIAAPKAVAAAALRSRRRLSSAG